MSVTQYEVECGGVMRIYIDQKPYNSNNLTTCEVLYVLAHFQDSLDLSR